MENDWKLSIYKLKLFKKIFKNIENRLNTFQIFKQDLSNL